MSQLAATLKPCACGKTHRYEMEHYDRVISECGRKWFVLQPRRNGPFVLVPHPGLNLTRWELAEKEAHDALRQAEGQV